MPFLPAPHGLRSRVNGVYRIIFLELGHVFLQGCFPGIHALHHMKRAPMAYVSQRDESRPLAIKNWCPETIFPGIATQAGTPPEIQGFELKSGGSRNLTVGADWQGRVWGRTNCSFNADGTGPASGTFGRACKTGDCYGVVDCKVTGDTPVTLAEFTLSSSSQQTFYDISLVDGYNIPLAIVSLYPESGDSLLTQIPPNLTNPICIGTAALLALEGSLQDANLGTNSSFPIPLDQTQSFSDVQKWCPWDLQLSPQTKPANGIYPYPDDSIQRPLFNPCYSACAKYNRPSDCCTGHYNSPNICKPSAYSSEAKKVCPDAYSFGKTLTFFVVSKTLIGSPAFDDQTSTFIIPSGGGFEVIFCPPGRSSTILATKSAQLHQLAQNGHITAQLLDDLISTTIIRNNSAVTSQARTAFQRPVGIILFLLYVYLSA